MSQQVSGRARIVTQVHLTPKPYPFHYTPPAPGHSSQISEGKGVESARGGSSQQKRDAECVVPSTALVVPTLTPRMCLRLLVVDTPQCSGFSLAFGRNAI